MGMLRSPNGEPRRWWSIGSQLRELPRGGRSCAKQCSTATLLAELEAQLQLLTGRGAKSADGLHDLLPAAWRPRSERRSRQDPRPPRPLRAGSSEASAHRRIAESRGRPRLGTSRLRHGAAGRARLAFRCPAGAARRLLEPVRAPLLTSPRDTREHTGRSPRAELARRYGLGVATAETPLRELEASGRIVQGVAGPGGREREWCDADVLRSLRQRSLARVPTGDRARRGGKSSGGFSPPGTESGSTRQRSSTRCWRVIEQLPGSAAHHVDPRDGSAAISSRWLQNGRSGTPSTPPAKSLLAGLEPVGERDGRIALYLTDQAAALLPLSGDDSASPTHERVREYLGTHGASFFADIHAGPRSGWATPVSSRRCGTWSGAGEVTNDSLAPLRAFLRPARGYAPTARPRPRYRVRRNAPPTARTLVAGRHTAVAHVGDGNGHTSAIEAGCWSDTAS